MTISHLLYQLLIQPLEILFEVIYRYTMIYVDNSGVAIIVMSLVMNFLLLPLYRRADMIQERERSLEKAMELGIAHIKQVYRGDERFMMLQTYYRQHQYKPYFILKGLVPLLLEIPFFIAAYHFLSNLGDLNGASFGPLTNLGLPDRLLKVSGLTVSVMPILMTVINIVSSMIYTKGFSRRDKLQLYGMAFVFLVLLYKSSSGLVLYWTLNNLFSLVKNIICWIPNYRRVLRAPLALIGVALLVYTLFFFPNSGRHLRILFAICAVLLQLPLLMPYLTRVLPKIGNWKPVFPEESSKGLFLIVTAFLTLLTGVLIPSAVIQSSPTEFVFFSVVPFPLIHVLDAFLLATGVFVIWMGVFYSLANNRWKWAMTAMLWVISLVAIADYMFFGTKLGNLSNTLIYDTEPVFLQPELIVNIACAVGLMIAGLLILRKSRKAVKAICTLLIVAVAGMSVMNIHSTQLQLSKMNIDELKRDASFEISKEGNNVIVIMLDRAISSYIPYLFHEKPELMQQFDGFTWYPNTLSYGGHTIFGAPPLFGGYEYTPEEINRRSGDQLVDKHDESLKVMPVLFHDAGFNVTVCDPSYAGYQNTPDLSIYDDYPDIHAYLTDQGQFFSPDDEFINTYKEAWERNFFCFSLMKCAPLCLQPYFYQNGTYFNSTIIRQPEQRMSCSSTVSWGFVNSYSALEALPEMTLNSEEKKDTFLLLCNSTTHEPTLLEEPSYTVSPIVDNRVFDRENTERFTVDGKTLRVETPKQMRHYQINMAALLQLGKWFDTLREAGSYDNCRIIIVADHGFYMDQFDTMRFGSLWYEDAMLYNPLLLVKDFNSHGFTVNEEFMTNADTPVLAFEGLISKPVNPFTGKIIDNKAKYDSELHVYASHDIHVSGSITTYPEDRWYAVSGDVRDGNNWSFIGEW